ncbi:T9SS type A sorting domain-containing protein [candidate division WOR-3 bacterium]|uniref:T9SS type A sorting domain-containing protein n=1 Tax=candidate division WOR-3 bacterium TaxID=2052148 RepID=A0A937XG48_UNCW3|nr:T9SS type A sorting domain-containing protein [candidate division WOR-3 bacterium]
MPQQMGLLLALLIAYPDSARFVDRTAWEYAPGYATLRCSARDSTGALHVVYSNNFGNGPGQISDIYYKRSTDNGLTWSDTFNVSETGRPRSVYPALAIDRRGRLHCSWWEDEVEGEYEEVFYRCRDSIGWQPVERVSYLRQRAGDPYSSLVCDTMNRAHLVWNLPPSPVEPREVWYSVRDDSGWTTPENLTRNPADDCAPLVTMDRFDNILLTWNERADRDRVAYRLKRGGQWSSRQILDTTWETGSASTAADTAGRFHATWCRGYLRTTDTLVLLYYAAYDTAWSQPVLVSESIHGSGMVRPHSMTVDSAGKVYVAWPRKFLRPHDKVQYDILYRTFNGQKWSPIVNLTSDTVYSYCPHLGYPVTDAGVDLFWTSQVPNAPNRWDVMFLQLSPASSAVMAPWRARDPISDMRVWPSITAGQLHLEGTEPAAVYDLSGRRLLDLMPGANAVGHLAPGVYFLRPETAQTTKFIIQR